MAQIPADIFNQMLPRAAAWAAAEEKFILTHKDAVELVPRAQDCARLAGVVSTERVRLLAVPTIPLPPDLDLRQAAKTFGLITTATAGLTLGHGIFVVTSYIRDLKLIAHELVHVAQYERHGGILAFLQKYLRECNEFGYPAAPMEQEAVAFAEKMYPQRSRGKAQS
jgi:hypothetical protein